MTKSQLKQKSVGICQIFSLNTNDLFDELQCTLAAWSAPQFPSVLAVETTTAAGKMHRVQHNACRSFRWSVCYSEHSSTGTRKSLGRKRSARLSFYPSRFLNRRLHSANAVRTNTHLFAATFNCLSNVPLMILQSSHYLSLSVIQSHVQSIIVYSCRWLTNQCQLHWRNK